MFLKAELGKLKVGLGEKVAVVAVMNLSPESFYKPSVQTRENALIYAQKCIEEGADIIDVGAVSSAPPSIYGLKEKISVREEIKRLEPVLKELTANLSIPLSVDTHRWEAAELALKKGVNIINDISGFKKDLRVAEKVAEYGASAFLMACKQEPGDVCGINEICKVLGDSLAIASSSGVNLNKIVLDPGVGFGKDPQCDLKILRDLRRFYLLGRPIMVGVSRKHFIGECLGGVPPEERLIGSLAATSIAVFKGAHVIRTHDVKETVEAVKVAERIRGDIKTLSSGCVSAVDIDFLETCEDLENYLFTLGVGKEGIKRMREKGVFHVFLLRNLSTPAVLVLKQLFLAAGGELATHKDVIDFNIERSDVLVLATEEQVRKVVKNLRTNSFGLREVKFVLERMLEMG